MMDPLTVKSTIDEGYEKYVMCIIKEWLEAKPVSLHVVSRSFYIGLLVECPSVLMKLEPMKGFDVMSVRNCTILSGRITCFN